METGSPDACTLEDVILCQHWLQEIIIRETMLQQERQDLMGEEDDEEAGFEKCNCSKDDDDEDDVDMNQ